MDNNTKKIYELFGVPLNLYLEINNSYEKEWHTFVENMSGDVTGIDLANGPDYSYINGQAILNPNW